MARPDGDDGFGDLFGFAQPDLFEALAPAPKAKPKAIVTDAADSVPETAPKPRATKRAKKAEAPTAESAAADESLSGESLAQESLTGESLTDGSLTDESQTDESQTDGSQTDGSYSNGSLADKFRIDAGKTSDNTPAKTHPTGAHDAATNDVLADSRSMQAQPSPVGVMGMAIEAAVASPVVDAKPRAPSTTEAAGKQAAKAPVHSAEETEADTVRAAAASLVVDANPRAPSTTEAAAKQAAKAPVHSAEETEAAMARAAAAAADAFYANRTPSPEAFHRSVSNSSAKQAQAEDFTTAEAEVSPPAEAETSPPVDAKTSTAEGQSEQTPVHQLVTSPKPSITNSPAAAATPPTAAHQPTAKVQLSSDQPVTPAVQAETDFNAAKSADREAITGQIIPSPSLPEPAASATRQAGPGESSDPAHLTDNEKPRRAGAVKASTAIRPIKAALKTKPVSSRPAAKAEPEEERPIRRRNRAGTTQAILLAGERVLAEEGFTNFGVNAVARRAECDKQLIYRYFGGVDGLLAAIGEGLAQRVAHKLSAQSSAKPKHYAELMERLLVAYLALLREDPLLFRLIAWELSEPSPLIRQLTDRRTSVLAAWLLRERGNLTPPSHIDVPVVQAILIGACQQLVLASVNQKAFGDVPLEEEVDWDRITLTLRRMVVTLFRA